MRQADDARGLSPEATLLAEELVATLGTVSDAALRVEYVRSEWLRLGPVKVAHFLEALAEGADAGIARHREAVHLASVALAVPRLAEFRAESGAHARAQGLERARGLLVPEPPREDASPGPPKFRPPPLAAGRPVTLGERKSIARKPDRALLDRILHDPDETVIAILLGNPALRESDVLRLASRRPVADGILRQIYVHPRWFVRYAVRFALVQNPNLPTDLALALVRTLHAQDASSVAQATELAASVRHEAGLSARRGGLH